MVDAATLGFAFGLGVSSFFSPCSVALVPAYVAYYSALPAGAETIAWHRSLVAGARFGLASAFGAFAVFGGVGALIYYLRQNTPLSSTDLGRALSLLAVVIALLVIGLGVLLLLGREVSLRLPLKAPQTKTLASMFTFGAFYSLASLGCSGPLFLAAMAQVFSQTAMGGLLVLLVYGAGLGVFLLAAAIALSLAQDQARRWIRNAMRFAKPVSGVVMILAGLYVILYYVWLAPPA